MDFEFSEDHRMLRDMVRDFAQSEVAPGAAERDKTHQIEPALIKQMAELGLLGVCIPDAYGGAGMDCVASTIVVEEVSRGVRRLRRLSQRPQFALRRSDPHLRQR